MREFETGATRSNVEGKLQYEGYLSPLVLQRFGQYMLEHQTQEDGKMRAADNWQKGMTLESYMDSMWRHFMDVWLDHRGYPDLVNEDLEDALCALMFNVMGYLKETLEETIQWK
jgi:hypothetical protein